MLKSHVTKFYCFIWAIICLTASPVHSGPVPDTGQITIYTSTFGEDGDYIINPQSFTKLDASGNDLPDTATSWVMVRDNVTGLIWEVKTDDGSIHDKDDEYTADELDTFIDTLNSSSFGGFTDWRVPNARELVGIVDKGTYSPAINTAYFPNTANYYWISNINFAPYADFVNCIVFDDGRIYDYYSATYMRIRAVRGNQYNSAKHFVRNGDGTITDTSTGLMWEIKSIDNRYDSYMEKQRGRVLKIDR